MATKIRILATAPAPALQMAETLKWVLRFVNEDPACIKIQRINQHSILRLVSKKDGKPVEASRSLRKELKNLEVKIIDC